MMNTRVSGGLTRFTFPAMERWPELVHGAFARSGGVSQPPYDSLNLSFAVRDDPDRVRSNRESMAAALEWDPGSIVSARQVHGRRVAAVGRQQAGGPDVSDCDALVTDEPGILLLMKFADCVPIVLWDPRHRVVGLVHAGWRGTILGTPAATVEAMALRYGSRPADILAGIGPSIGPCCYQVGPEVVVLAAKGFAGADVLVRDADGSTRFDLWRANAETLMRAGVPEENVAVGELCTRCRSDLFFSHRAAGGLAGRFGVVAGIRNG